MCWRDDVVMTRYCSFCGKEYYGDLGHRGCRAFLKKQSESVEKADEPWICEGCKEKQDITTHRCKIKEKKFPDQVGERVCGCWSCVF